MTFKTFLAAAIAASLLMPAPAISAPDDGKSVNKPAKKRATMTVKKRIWKGYGFLPGYPRSERERQRDKYLSEPRYYTVHGGYYLGGGFYSGGYVSGPSYGWGGRASTAANGTAAASGRAGPRRRSARNGIAGCSESYDSFAFSRAIDWAADRPGGTIGHQTTNAGGRHA